MCYDESALPTTLNVQWNWDDGAWPGGNTGDACALFDTDNDGKANYAFCTTVGQSPAVFLTRTLYSCNDTKSDRCAGKALLNDYSPSVPGESSCGIAITATDPFPTGDYSPNDTTADCDITLAELSDTDPKLIDVCSYPSEEPNSDPSDCIIATSNPTTKLEVIKQLVPTNDPGLFNLSIGGTTYATNVGHNGTTGEQVLLASNSGTTAYSFAEAAGLNTILSNYTSSVVCKDGNGTGSVIATTGTNPWTVNIAKDKDVVCTITNTLKQGTLIVNKVIVGSNESPTAFSYTVNGGSSINFEADGSNSATVTPGSYTIVENDNPNYTTTYGTCTNLVVPSNGSATCTITNTLKPSYLTVVKTVTNDNGGNQNPDDFNLKVGNTSVLSGVKTQFTAGSYTVSETNQPGYLAGVWGTDCASNGSVTLVPGDDKTCTITNNDIAPTLTVIKNVVNDNGGTKVSSDFTMNVTGTNVSDDSFAGSSTGTTVTLNAGSYSVDENTVTGYAKTLGANCSGTIALGENKTCTITNNDIAPELTVIKTVVNDNGGTKVSSDFTMNVTGTNVSDDSFAGSSTGTTVTLNAGSYSVDENTVTGYAKTLGNDCSGTIAIGEKKTCEITNNDIQPKLTVVKIVDNDNGGILLVNDFDLFVEDTFTNVKTQVVSGETNGFNAGSYVVSEDSVLGYEGTISGDCDETGSVTLTIGDNKSCVITNDDVTPTLTVIKTVVNDNGGTKASSDFTMNVTGTNVSDNSFPGSSTGTTVTLNAGSYSVDEIELDGYAKTLGNDCSGTISVGDNKVCTIINDDIQPTLKLTKTVVNDNGGDAVVSDFPLSVENSVEVSTVMVSGEAKGLDADTYIASEINQPGYAAGLWGGDCSTDGTVTLEVGDNKECTITNDDISPKLTVIKTVVNDNGGKLEVSDFPLFVGLTPVVSGVANDFDAGNYTVSETNQPGYAAGVWGGDCDAQGNVTLELEEEYTCTITNDDVQPTLKLTKIVVNNNGGKAVVSDFPLSVENSEEDTTEMVSGEVKGLDADTYTALEINQPGYDGGDWTGDCSEDGTVTLEVGDNKECTITNDDIAAELTVIKEVINDNGGTKVSSDFTMNVTGTNVSDDSFVGSSTGTTVTLDAGTYSVDEVELYGYAKTLGDNCSGTISVGEKKTCTITNDDIQPTLKLTKVVINDNGGDSEVSDFPLSVENSEEDTTEMVSGEVKGLDADTYTALEMNQPGYEAGAWTGDCSEDGTVTLEVGDNKECTITNDDIAPELTVVKNVVNDNGGTATVDDFDIKLNDNNIKFNSGDEFGDTTSYTSYPEVSANTPYTLYEDTSVDYYDAGTWSCVDTQAEETVGEVSQTDGQYNLELELGQTVECVITNDDKEPRLEIEKINDAVGNKEAGEQVKYTITVKVLDSAVHNLLVTDLLPISFEFVTGSSEVKVGATPKIAAEPTYSDGTAEWNLESLGNLLPGDIVTISYLALVTTDTDPGLYKDIAWAVAESGKENIVEEIIYSFSLAEHESPVQVYALATGAGALEACNEQDCGNFVGTEVSIVETNIEEAGVVLGTRTVELPNTGMNPIMLIASIISMISGIVLVLFSLGMNMKKSKKLASNVLALVIGVGVFASLSSSTFAASSTILRVETPATSTNSVFNIGYTVSNLNNETVDVTCLVKKPGDFGFSTYGSVFTTPNGGASAECVVNNSVLSAGEGTYVFKVDTDKTDESPEYSVDYDTVKPGTPTNFSKTEAACTYDVAFKTASDGGQTVKVEIFRSTEKSFNADASTLVGTVVAGSNESKVFNNAKPNCDTTYFYALRAVDEAGNTSDFVGDTIVVTQVVNVPGDNTNNNGGNTGTDNNGEVEGETDTNKPGDNDGDDNGEVKGDDDTDNPTDNPTDDQNQNDSNNNGSWTTVLAWIGGILLGIIIVWQLVQRGIVQKVFQRIVRR